MFKKKKADDIEVRIGNSCRRLERHGGLFRLFGFFDDDRVAFGRLGMKAFGASRSFSARLARASWCAKLREEGWHHPTNLPGGNWSLFAFPWSVQGSSQGACHIQLIEDDGHQPAPALKLLGSPHMHPRPKQIAFEKAVAMLLRETQAIALGNLTQRHNVIEHHKPTDPGITFGVFCRFSLHPNDFDSQLAVLFEMQVAPSARSHSSALGIQLTRLSFRGSMALLAFSLKDGTVFGHGPLFVATHGRPIELAVAFHADDDTDAQVAASP